MKLECSPLLVSSKGVGLTYVLKKNKEVQRLEKLGDQSCADRGIIGEYPQESVVLEYEQSSV